MRESELFRRLVKNSGYLFSTTGVSAALGMLQGILVARLLGVDNFGVLAALITFTSLINNLASFRMGELVVKYVGHYSEKGEGDQAAAVFKAAAIFEMLASLVAFGLICLLAPFGARYLAKDPAAAPLFVTYGLVVLFNLIAESSTGLLQIYDRFRRIAAINLVQSVFTLALIAVVYVMSGSLLGVILAYIGGKALGALSLTLMALVEAAYRWGTNWWRTSLSAVRQQWRELAGFAVSTNISATINLVNKDSELFWVPLFRTPAETGYYKLALSLANLVEMPVNPLPQTTYPELSRQAAQRNWDAFRYLLRRGSLLAGGYTLAATLVLVILGQPLIRIFYTAEFLPAYPALMILLVGFLVANTFYWRRIALLSLGRADFPAKLNAVLAVLKIIGILLFVPRYGYLASAALLAGFYWAGSIISVLKTRSLLSQHEGVGEEGMALKA
jgi:O-antigen/teichoic acid export membrane protein